MRAVTSDEEVEQVFDTLQLETALKHLHSATLETRIKGLRVYFSYCQKAYNNKSIGKLIMRTRPPEENRIGMWLTYYGRTLVNPELPAEKPPPPMRQIPVQYVCVDNSTNIFRFLLQWLVKNDVFSQICDFAHPELIRYGNEILEFGAANGFLSCDHIDRIWAQSLVTALPNTLA